MYPAFSQPDSPALRFGPGMHYLADFLNPFSNQTVDETKLQTLQEKHRPKILAVIQ